MVKQKLAWHLKTKLPSSDSEFIFLGGTMVILLQFRQSEAKIKQYFLSFKCSLKLKISKHISLLLHSKYNLFDALCTNFDKSGRKSTNLVTLIVVYNQTKSSNKQKRVVVSDCAIFMETGRCAFGTKMSSEEKVNYIFASSALDQSTNV